MVFHPDDIHFRIYPIADYLTWVRIFECAALLTDFVAPIYAGMLISRGKKGQDVKKSWNKMLSDVAGSCESLVFTLAKNRPSVVSFSCAFAFS